MGVLSVSDPASSSSSDYIHAYRNLPYAKTTIEQTYYTNIWDALEHGSYRVRSYGPIWTWPWYTYVIVMTHMRLFRLIHLR